MEIFRQLIKILLFTFVDNYIKNAIYYILITYLNYLN